MKKLMIPIVFVILLVAGACQKSIMYMSGVRAPEIESKKSICSFLESIHEDTTDVYSLDTVAFNKLRSAPFKPGWKTGFRPVQIRVYGNKGEPLMQWASCEGYLKDLGTFDSVPPKNVNGLDTSWNLAKDLKQYFTLNGTPANLSPMPGYDYHVLVYFARYFPKLSKESFRQVEKYVHQHPDLKFRVYKIDVDFRDFWGIDLESKTSMRVVSGN